MSLIIGRVLAGEGAGSSQLNNWYKSVHYWTTSAARPAPAGCRNTPSTISVAGQRGEVASLECVSD